MTRLHHVNVVVPTGQTALVQPFYTQVLGLRPVGKPGDAGRGGAWLELGDGTQVHVSERDGAAHPDAHFGMVVDDFAAVLERLAAAGAPWTEQEDLFGGRRGFTRDPAGNRVEILERAGELS